MPDLSWDIIILLGIWYLLLALLVARIARHDP
jgi:hypothetical protein